MSLPAEPPADQPADALTPSEAATMLGVSLSTLARYATRGIIPSHRLPSGHRRYRRTDIEAWLATEPEDLRPPRPTGP